MQVVELQARGFFTAHAVIQQHRESRPVTLTFDRRRIGRLKQGLGLVIGKGRGFALSGFQLQLFAPAHRVAAGDRIAVEQVIEQAALLELAALGEDMGRVTSRNCSGVCRPTNWQNSSMSPW